MALVTNPTVGEVYLDAIHGALCRAGFEWTPVHLRDAEDGLRSVDVEGELRDAEVTSWSALLNGAIADGTRGIAVDLRGCTARGVLDAPSTRRCRGEARDLPRIAASTQVQAACRTTRLYLRDGGAAVLRQRPIVDHYARMGQRP